MLRNTCDHSFAFESTERCRRAPLVRVFGLNISLSADILRTSLYENAALWIGEKNAFEETQPLSQLETPDWLNHIYVVIREYLFINSQVLLWIAVCKCVR